MSAPVNLLVQIGFTPRQASHLGYTIDGGVVAGGLFQSDATPLTSSINEIIQGAAGSGVILPMASSSPICQFSIKNRTNVTVANTVNIYPAVDDTIFDGIGMPNVPYSLTVGSVVTLYKATSNGVSFWYVF